MSLCLSCVNWKVRIWKIALLWTPKQTYQCVPTVRWIHYDIYFFKTVIASGLYFSGNVCSFLKGSLCGFTRGSGYETLSKRMPSVICLEYTRCLTVAVINNAVTTPLRWSKGIHFAASLSGGGLKAFWALCRTLLACEWRKTQDASVLKVTCGADFGKTTALCDGTKYLGI